MSQTPPLQQPKGQPGHISVQSAATEQARFAAKAASTASASSGQSLNDPRDAAAPAAPWSPSVPGLDGASAAAGLAVGSCRVRPQAAKTNTASASHSRRGTSIGARATDGALLLMARETSRTPDCPSVYPRHFEHQSEDSARRELGPRIGDEHQPCLAHTRPQRVVIAYECAAQRAAVGTVIPDLLEAVEPQGGAVRIREPDFEQQLVAVRPRPEHAVADADVCRQLASSTSPRIGTQFAVGDQQAADRSTTF
jgi:hypothetical protein